LGLNKLEKFRIQMWSYEWMRIERSSWIYSR